MAIGYASPYNDQGTLIPRTCGFGIYTKLPDLPKGYDWIQKANDFLLVRDPFGRFYYADFLADGRVLLMLRVRAGLWDWMRTRGKFRIGDYYCDERFTMFLPTSPEPSRK